MSILDAGSVYTNTGDILQLRYAQKAADSGNTVICLKNTKGIVVLVEKPIQSQLFISDKNHKIKKVTSSIYQVASGIETDLNYVNTNLRNKLVNDSGDYDMEISFENYRSELVRIIHMFTRYTSTRPLGINILSCIRYNNSYKVLLSDCTGKSLFYKSCVMGKGARVVKTELEKLCLDDLSINQMIENGIRMMYKAHDPLKEKAFDFEIGVICDESHELVRLNKEQYIEYVDKYQYYSVDGEE